MQADAKAWHEGYIAGQHSMDAEHRAVAMRLRQLPLDGGSHENLSQIARAIWHSDFGWTHGACAALRDKLIDLMGGVSDELSEPLKTINLNDGYNHFLKTGDGDDTRACAGGGACAADCGCDSGEQEVRDDCTDGDTLGPDARSHAVGRDFHELGVSDGRTGDSCIRSHPLRSVGRNDVCVRRDSGEHSGGQEVEHGGAAHDCADDFRGGSGSDVVHMDGVTYDVLDNERRKTVAELRKMSNGYPEYASAPFARWYAELCEALGIETGFGNVRDRLIHLLGGNQPTLSDLYGIWKGEDSEPTMEVAEGCMTVRHGERELKFTKDNVYIDGKPVTEALVEKLRCKNGECNFSTPENDMDAEDGKPNPAEASDGASDYVGSSIHSIADELRQCVETATKTYDDTAWHEMDGNEDEHTWCSVTVTELLGIADRIDAQYDQLQAKLDEYDRTHAELPRDKNGEVFCLGCTVRMVGRQPEVLLTVHGMTVYDDGEWWLYARDDKEKYSCNLRTSEFEVCDKPQDTAESIVRDLSMGSITESEAIGRIEALNG